MSFTIGSLFDGSGGFPLAGFLSGGVPIWAAEIEPYPIAVTTSRFPMMKHLGSVTDINGGEVEPVDVLCGGSPCQDLSVAGKRAGLKHEDNGDEETTRSGLFMEQIRIIKEMREATNGVHPRFAVWENVPGAFSSNKGEDFRKVLQEFIQIVEPTAVMPEVPKNGWPYADCYSGDGWSIAYRVFDAQFWGVPQRRRRIYLVADFGGQCAREVLFEREGLRGYFAEGRTPWETAPRDAADCPGTADCTRECVGFDMYNQQSTGAVSRTIKTPVGGDDLPVVCYGISPYHSNSMLSDNPHSGIYVADTSRTLDLNGGNPCCNQGGIAIVEPKTVCLEGNGSRPSHSGDGWSETDVMYTLNTIERHGVAYCLGNGQTNQGYSEEVAGALNCMHDQQAVCYAMQGFGDYKDCGVASGLKQRDYKDATDLVVEQPIVLDRAFYNQGVNAQYDPQLYEDGICPTLVAKGPSAVCTQYIVRRLTPTECARLQGFPDKWGHPDQKSEFSDAEYEFWLNVRNTHAAINGKAVKSYSKDQMVKWYNKLHTDSSEYKMWGNGIALPNAFFVMSGIAEVFGN